jgi:hypothetical protein
MEYAAPGTKMPSSQAKKSPVNRASRVFFKRSGKKPKKGIFVFTHPFRMPKNRKVLFRAKKIRIAIPAA